VISDNLNMDSGRPMRDTFPQDHLSSSASDIPKADEFVLLLGRRLHGGPLERDRLAITTA
jgi:hypothetical protein